jgi:hypothetical protein
MKPRHADLSAAGIRAMQRLSFSDFIGVERPSSMVGLVRSGRRRKGRQTTLMGIDCGHDRDAICDIVSDDSAAKVVFHDKSSELWTASVGSSCDGDNQIT